MIPDQADQRAIYLSNRNWLFVGPAARRRCNLLGEWKGTRACPGLVLLMYKAILFDMDGVVVDTHQAVTAFWQQVAADYRCSMTSEDLNQYVYGRSASETFDALFSHLT